MWQLRSNLSRQQGDRAAASTDLDDLAAQSPDGRQLPQLCPVACEFDGRDLERRDSEARLLARTCRRGIEPDGETGGAL